jgi:hypothetical protein
VSPDVLTTLTDLPKENKKENKSSSSSSSSSNKQKKKKQKAAAAAKKAVTSSEAVATTSTTPTTSTTASDGLEDSMASLSMNESNDGDKKNSKQKEAPEYTVPIPIGDKGITQIELQ